MSAHLSVLPPRPRISDIQRMVAEQFGSTVREMLSRRRHASIAHPRQVAIFLAAELTSHSLAGIGRLFERDHTTVIYAITAVRQRMAEDSDLADRIAGLHARLLARAEQEAKDPPCTCRNCLIEQAEHPFDPRQIPLPIGDPNERIAA